MRVFCTGIVLFLLQFAPQVLGALSEKDVRAAAVGESDDRIAAINRISNDGSKEAAAFLKALAEDQVKISGERIILVEGTNALDPLSGNKIELPKLLDDVVNNNRVRAEIDSAIAAMALSTGSEETRMKAARALISEPDENKLPQIEKALGLAQGDALKSALGLAKASILLSSSDAALRLQAAKTLGASQDTATKPLITARLKKDGDTYVEPDGNVRAALAASMREIDSRLVWGQRIGEIFSGVSLGSILLLAALGLAITYGLMGVINMAHGELMMIGAYATYLVQVGVRKFAPGVFDWYPIIAIPIAFFAAAAIGALMERTVIRFLYGRPLETLLATWGLSLILMQSVRSLFGAQNVPVENPSWMSGGITIFSGTVIPYNRIAVLVFAGLVLALVTYLVQRTRLGLFVRGVTQNRSMASCMGVNTSRVDTYAFALGAGIAGLAGCALAQLGNVGPDLGQSYIVDSFMVVVLGGVGQLAGTVIAALGLGVLNKALEGVAGAVLAKIAVLVFIIVFIQKRPSGLFALKGRSAEA
jgi:urea transport system permease protein